MPILASPTKKELLSLHTLLMKRNHQCCIFQKKVSLMFCPSPEGAVTAPHTPEKELLAFPTREPLTLFPRRSYQHPNLPKKELLMPPHKGPPLFCSPSKGATAALNSHAQGGGDTQPPQTRASSDLAPVFRKSHLLPSPSELDATWPLSPNKCCPSLKTLAPLKQ